jgi:hypothetical protein
MGCMHSQLRDGSQAKLDLLLSVLKGIMRCEGGKLPPKVIPQIRETVEPHYNPSAFRRKLDDERNAETEELSHKFYEVYQAGVFTAWRCMYDVGRGRPTNPEALVGEEVGREFEEFPNVIFAGAIVSYDSQKRWWKVVFEDGDTADYNFRELTKFVKPPNFSSLTYEATTACAEYLAEVSVENIFRLEGVVFKMINIYCDHCTRIFWCAYCPLEDFCDGMEELTRNVLRTTFAEVEFATYEDVKVWVKAYETEKAATKNDKQRAKDTRTRNSDYSSDSGNPYLYPNLPCNPNPIPNPTPDPKSTDDDDVPFAVLLDAFR